MFPFLWVNEDELKVKETIFFLQVCVDKCIGLSMTMKCPLSYRIVCVTGPASVQSQKGKVRVIVRNTHSGVSAKEFRYVVSTSKYRQRFNYIRFDSQLLHQR